MRKSEARRKLASLLSQALKSGQREAFPPHKTNKALLKRLRVGLLSQVKHMNALKSRTDAVHAVAFQLPCRTCKARAGQGCSWVHNPCEDKHVFHLTRYADARSKMDQERSSDGSNYHMRTDQ